MTRWKNIIREGLLPGDAERISDLMSSAPLSLDSALPSVGVGERYFREKFDSERVKEWTDDFIFTAWDADVLVGFGRARKDGFITHVFVRDGFRGEGLGTRLLTILEETLGSTGHTWLFLDADPNVVPFYECNGWVRRESDAVDLKAVLPVPMEKRLS